jgi:hypothetical protein
VAAVIVAAAIVVLGNGALTAMGEPVSPLFSGLLATFAGIVAGIPAALALAEEDRAASIRRAEDDRAERRNRVLRQIWEDLQDAKNLLLASDRHRREGGVAPFLGLGLWDALKAAGGVSLIEDADVVREVSRAYDRIALTAYLERVHWELLYNPVAHMGMDPPLRLIPAVLKQVEGQDEHTRAAIEHAQTVIGQIYPRVLAVRFESG